MVRLKASDVDMRLFTNTIQGGDLHFAQLCGALPIVCDDTVMAKLETSVHDFTVGLDYTQAKTVRGYIFLIRKLILMQQLCDRNPPHKRAFSRCGMLSEA